MTGEKSPATVRYDTRYTVADVWAIRSDVCSALCDAAPEVTFVDEWGIEVHTCRDCYERPCGRCLADIEKDQNRRKRLCQDCRDEIQLWGGREDRGIEKQPETEQTTLLTAGGGDRGK